MEAIYGRGLRKKTPGLFILPIDKLLNAFNNRNRDGYPCFLS